MENYTEIRTILEFPFYRGCKKGMTLWQIV